MTSLTFSLLYRFDSRVTCQHIISRRDMSIFPSIQHLHTIRFEVTQEQQLQIHVRQHTFSNPIIYPLS